MPAIPTTVSMIGAGFVPAFRRVQQSDDFDCSFAAIAMICGTTLEAVRNIAIEQFGHPAHGPYWITGALIASLLEHYGYETGMYEEPVSVGEIPNLAIAWWNTTITPILADTCCSIAPAPVTTQPSRLST